MCVCDTESFKNNTEFRYTELLNPTTGQMVRKGLGIAQDVRNREELSFGTHTVY